ncbi:MAG: hypothetical protein M0R37_13670 [Bacteroidales bacterium]|jgi:hypothetical protein|nr:hypothetical protein [Sphaerochaeta sp.]MCK9629625.1 hypothetical protein [Bacteroidales bacterium]
METKTDTKPDTSEHLFADVDIPEVFGMPRSRFSRLAEAGLIGARRGKGGWLVADVEVYRLVTVKHPSALMGRSTWLTCGRHVQLYRADTTPTRCPGQPGYIHHDCGLPLRPAEPDEVAQAMFSTLERREFLRKSRIPAV